MTDYTAWKNRIVTWEARGKSCYEAYGSITDFKNYQGLPMPDWKDLPPTIQTAWIAAAKRSQIDAANTLLIQTIDENDAPENL